jgi:hypothetical protein
MAKDAVDRHFEEKHVPTGSMIDVLMARGVGYYEIVAEMASKMYVITYFRDHLKHQHNVD